MEIPIIFEDSEIVVIDKPSGVVCNRADTVESETLQDWFAKRYNMPIISGQTKFGEQAIDYVQYFAERLGLVHRLDRETSGVMVMAKTPGAFESLLKQFKEHGVQKVYRALTHGFWTAREGKIDLPIARRRDDRKKFGGERRWERKCDAV